MLAASLTTLVPAALAASFSKDLAALHGVHDITGKPCDAVFLDIGSHTGGTLWDFFMRQNCYEVCGGDASCRPENWSSGSCRFCNSANMARQCGWFLPWWLPRDIRRTYCAVAFEPSPVVADRLRTRVDDLRRQLPGVSVRVLNDTAVSVREGMASFGVDSGAYEGRASSLALSRKAPLKDPNASRHEGAIVEVGSQQQVRVRTLDIVHYLRALKVPSIAMWLSVEGAEFEMMRDLLTSGVLCAKVDNLWMDWHPNRIEWKKERLPTSDVEMYHVYKWMLTSMDNSAKHQTGTADPDSHCKTAMFTTSERRLR